MTSVGNRNLSINSDNMPKIHLKSNKNIVFERPAKTRRFNTSAGMANFSLDSTHGGRRDADKRRDELHIAGLDVRRVAGAATHLKYAGAQREVYHLYTRKSKIRGKSGQQKYKYERVDVAVPGSAFLAQKKQYFAPVERKQTQIMEYLTQRDKEIVADAYRRGLAVEEIINYVADVSGVRVSAATIYAYCRRHGIKRGKRDRRSDAGKERAIQLSGADDIEVRKAWRAGETWQEIQKRIRAATGTKVSKSAIYAYFRERGISRRK